MGTNLIPDDVLNIIQHNKFELCKQIKPSIPFLAALQSNRVLTLHEIQTVEQEKTDFDKNYWILNYLQKTTPRHLAGFKESLIITEQDHMIKYVSKEDSGSERSQLGIHEEKGTIDSRMHNIKSVNWSEHEKWVFNYFDIEEKTIQFLEDENYTSFSSLMERSEDLGETLKQSRLHWCQIAKVNSFIEELKLAGEGISDQNRHILEIKELTLLIEEPFKIISQLFDQDVLTGYDLKMLKSCSSDEERFKDLFNLLQLKSNNCFNVFLDTLKAAGQGHVANLIQTGGIQAFKTGMG